MVLVKRQQVEGRPGMILLFIPSRLRAEGQVVRLAAVTVVLAVLAVVQLPAVVRAVEPQIKDLMVAALVTVVVVVLVKPGTLTGQNMVETVLLRQLLGPRFFVLVAAVILGGMVEGERPLLRGRQTRVEVADILTAQAVARVLAGQVLLYSRYLCRR